MKQNLNEVKRMQQLAGLLKEGMQAGKSDLIITLDYDNEMTKIEDKHYHQGADGAVESETDVLESNFDPGDTMSIVEEYVSRQEWNKIIIRVIYEGEEMEDEFTMGNWKGISYYVK